MPGEASHNSTEALHCYTRHTCLYFDPKSLQIVVLPFASLQVIWQKTTHYTSTVRYRSPYQFNKCDSLKQVSTGKKFSNEKNIGVKQKDAMLFDGSLELKFIPKIGKTVAPNCVVLNTITASENTQNSISETDYADLAIYNSTDGQF